MGACMIEKFGFVASACESSCRAASRVAERELDHARVVLVERAAGAEVQRLLRVPRRRPVAAVHVQRPRECVGDVDRVPPAPLRARGAQGESRVAVVGLIQRELQVDVHAVGLEEALDRADETELPARERGPSCPLVGLAERRHVVAGGIPLHDVAIASDRGRDVPTSPCHLREPCDRRDVRRIESLGEPVVVGGARDVAAVPLELPELILGPGPVRIGTRRSQRGAHRLHRAAHVALELPGVGDARVRRHVGLGVDHRLERSERRGVPPELDLRVADHAVHVTVGGVELHGALAPAQRSGKVVSRGGQSAHPDVRAEVVVRLQRERATKRPLRLGVVGGIGVHPRLLDVGDPEGGERAGVLRVQAKFRLELRDEIGDGAVARPERCLGRGRRNHRDRGPVGCAGDEQAQAADDEQHRHRQGHDGEPSEALHVRSPLRGGRGPARRPDPFSSTVVSRAGSRPNRSASTPRTGTSSGSSRRWRSRRLRDRSDVR